MMLGTVALPFESLQSLFGAVEQIFRVSMDIECSSALLFLQNWCQLGLPLLDPIRKFGVESEILCALCKSLNVNTTEFFKSFPKIGFFVMVS